MENFNKDDAHVENLQILNPLTCMVVFKREALSPLRVFVELISILLVFVLYVLYHVALSNPDYKCEPGYGGSMGN